jgi:uncharacterized protein (UPF0305 family)
MRIIEVVEIYPVAERKVYVKAIAENSRLVYHQTQYDPPEYGDSYVEAFISILDLEDFFDMDITEDTIIEELVEEYLKEINFDLDWRVIENDY